jgi:hypothetical protein
MVDLSIVVNQMYFVLHLASHDISSESRLHYDHETHRPEIFEGHSSNILFPDLVDPTKSPQFFVEPADSDVFVFYAFMEEPPTVRRHSFKIINREWNISRKEASNTLLNGEPCHYTSISPPIGIVEKLQRSIDSKHTVELLQ